MIREATLKDLEFVNSLMSSFNINVYNEFNNPFVKFLIYELDKKIVGVIDYSFFDNRIEINYIIVDDKYRRMGLATKMLDFLIENNNNIENITLEVSSKNNVAIDFYHKNKFCDVSVRKNYYPDGVDAIMMIRRF